MEIQREFQDSTGLKPSVQELASAIMTEGGELWSISGGKWWKNYLKDDSPTPNKPRGALSLKVKKWYLDTVEDENFNKILEESIDILHFLLCVWIKLDVTPQHIFKEYCKQMDVNKTRQENNY